MVRHTRGATPLGQRRGEERLQGGEEIRQDVAGSLKNDIHDAVAMTDDAALRLWARGRLHDDDGHRDPQIRWDTIISQPSLHGIFESTEPPSLLVPGRLLGESRNDGKKTSGNKGKKGDD